MILLQIIIFVILFSYSCLQTKQTSSISIQPNQMDMRIDQSDQDQNIEDISIQQENDLDHDGFSIEDGDCNDDDPEIHPNALEIFGDQIDQNCRREPCEPDCPNIDFIELKQGYFIMGGMFDDAQPMHQVEIAKKFYMSKTEITNAQYRKCVEVGVCSEPDLQSDRIYCNWGDLTRDHHPVNCIDWKQARIFSQWLGGDLPSEAQWEYAASSQGEITGFPWGQLSANCDLANYQQSRNIDCVGYTSPVCSTILGNSKQGLCDMAGNVAEWTLDEYDADYISAPINGNAKCSDFNCVDPQEDKVRTSRGGGWASVEESLSIHKRNQSSTQWKTAGLGFRMILK